MSETATHRQCKQTMLIRKTLTDLCFDPKKVEIQVHLAWLFMSITINSISNVLKVLEMQFIMAITYFQC